VKVNRSFKAAMARALANLTDIRQVAASGTTGDKEPIRILAALVAPAFFPAMKAYPANSNREPGLGFSPHWLFGASHECRPCATANFSI
jgi:hypothetical protein